MVFDGARHLAHQLMEPATFQWWLMFLEEAAFYKWWCLASLVLFYVNALGFRRFPDVSRRLFPKTLAILAAIFATRELNQFVKTLVNRSRPIWNEKRGEFGRTPAWPSGHASLAGLISYFGRTYIFPAPTLVGKMGRAAVIAIELLIAVSRVAMGRHFLGDVIFGLLLGEVNSLLIDCVISQMFPAQQQQHHQHGGHGGGGGGGGGGDGGGGGGDDGGGGGGGGGGDGGGGDGGGGGGGGDGGGGDGGGGGGGGDDGEDEEDDWEDEEDDGEDHDGDDGEDEEDDGEDHDGDDEEDDWEDEEDDGEDEEDDGGGPGGGPGGGGGGGGGGAGNAGNQPQPQQQYQEEPNENLRKGNRKLPVGRPLAPGQQPIEANEQLLSLFLFHQLPPEPSVDDQLAIIRAHVDGGNSSSSPFDEQSARQLLQLVRALASHHSSPVQAVASSLSLHRLIYPLRRHAAHLDDEGLWTSVDRAALARFLPAPVQKALEAEMLKAGLKRDSPGSGSGERILRALLSGGAGPERGSEAVDTLCATKRQKLGFYDNVQHLDVLEDMARDFALGSPLLLIGNQGVGKNKVTDRFLELLHRRPRKYMQLHRDTAVHSLMVMSSVVDENLCFSDSPLVEAVRDGLVLVVDEGNKAPLHVVSVLKALLDSEQLHLADGRRICPSLKKNGKELASVDEDGKIIYIHPDFRLIVLANRPGFAFLGNDLCGLLGDLFAVYTINNPLKRAELEMLAKCWTGRDRALRNVFDFDAFSRDTRDSVREALSLGDGSDSGTDAGAYGNWARLLGMDGKGKSIEEKRIEFERDGSVFDLSKLTGPKFWELDSENMPHIGRNTWASGVSGYNTAGLGGVGSPFRMNAGHPVHQLSDSEKALAMRESCSNWASNAAGEMRARVEELDASFQRGPQISLLKATSYSDEAQELNRAEYAKRLREIEMSEYDAGVYGDLRARAERSTNVLRAIIDSLE